MLKTGVQSLGWYRAEDPIGSFAYIKSCGFDAVDFNIDQYLPVGELNTQKPPYASIFDKSAQELCAFFAPLKEAVEKTGVEICQMHAPFPVEMPENDALNDHIFMALEKCLEVCRFVGCPAIVVHPLTKRESLQEEYEDNLALYRRLIPAAKRTGVKVCLENLFTQKRKRLVAVHLAPAREMCRLLDQLNAEAGADCFGFCFDIGHANICGYDVPEYVHTLGRRLTILHLHDNNGEVDLHVTPYSHTVQHSGVTVCDWQGFVNALGDIDYKGVLCFETFGTLFATPKAVHTEALKLISAIGHAWAEELEAKKG